MGSILLSYFIFRVQGTNGEHSTPYSIFRVSELGVPIPVA